MPELSVIIPLYNAENYIETCVRSILGQSWKDMEILIVDDGSTDGTSDLCDRLAEEDPRIRVFHKENGGSSRARNFALQHARGEYVGFVDSDDYIEPDMYQLLWEGIRHFQVSAAQVGRDEIDEAGNRLPNICEPPERAAVMDSGTFFTELLLHRGDCSFCTKLIRRDLFPEEAFPAGKLNEDFQLLIRMLPGMGRLALLPQQTYHVFYRIGSNSRLADRNDFSPVYGDCVDNADLAMEIVRRDYPEAEEAAFRFGVFQRLEYLLHIPIRQMTKENETYRKIVVFLRKNWFYSMKNTILTRKNKVYHTLFALAPKGIRRLHAMWKKL